jgi:hypothetical protein
MCTVLSRNDFVVMPLDKNGAEADLALMVEPSAEYLL